MQLQIICVFFIIHSAAPLTSAEVARFRYLVTATDSLDKSHTPSHTKPLAQHTQLLGHALPHDVPPQELSQQSLYRLLVHGVSQQQNYSSPARTGVITQNVPAQHNYSNQQCSQQQGFSALFPKQALSEPPNLLEKQAHEVVTEFRPVNVPLSQQTSNVLNQPPVLYIPYRVRQSQTPNMPVSTKPTNSNTGSTSHSRNGTASTVFKHVKKEDSHGRHPEQYCSKYQQPSNQAGFTLQELETCSLEDLMARMTAQLSSTRNRTADSNTPVFPSHPARPITVGEVFTGPPQTSRGLNYAARSSSKPSLSFVGSQVDNPSHCYGTDHGPVTMSRRGNIDSTGGLVLHSNQKSYPSTFKLDDNKNCMTNFQSNSSSVPSNNHDNVKKCSLNVFHKVNDNKFINEKYVDIRCVMTNSDFEKVNRCAVKIQSTFRGHLVRRVTGQVLNKNLIVPPKSSRPTNLLHKPTKRKHQHRNTPVKSSGTQTQLLTGDITESSDPVAQRRELLCLGKIELLNESKYRVTNRHVPDNVKPFIELLETGDLDEFVNSRGRELNAIREQELNTRNNNHHKSAKKNKENRDAKRPHQLDRYSLAPYCNDGISVNNNVTEHLDKEVQTSEGLTKMVIKNNPIKTLADVVNDKSSNPINLSTTVAKDEDFLPLQPKPRHVQMTDYRRENNIVNRVDHRQLPPDTATPIILPQLTAIDLSASQYKHAKKDRVLSNLVQNTTTLTNGSLDDPDTSRSSKIDSYSLVSNSNYSTNVSEEIPDDGSFQYIPLKQNNSGKRINFVNARSQNPKVQSSKQDHCRPAFSVPDVPAGLSDLPQRIDPTTGEGASPATLQRRFDAELLHQDVVSAAMRHLDELENIRLMSQAKHADFKRTGDDRETSSHTNMQKDDRDISQGTRNCNDSYPKNILKYQGISRNCENVGHVNEKSQKVNAPQNELLILQETLDRRQENALVEQQHHEEAEKVLEKQLTLIHEKERVQRELERIDKRTIIKQKNQEIQKEIQIQQQVGVVIRKKYKPDLIDSKLSLRDLELRAEESLERLNREVRAKADSIFRSTGDSICKDRPAEHVATPITPSINILQNLPNVSASHSNGTGVLTPVTASSNILQNLPNVRLSQSTGTGVDAHYINILQEQTNVSATIAAAAAVAAVDATLQSLEKLRPRWRAPQSTDYTKHSSRLLQCSSPSTSETEEHIASESGSQSVGETEFTNEHSASEKQVSDNRDDLTPYDYSSSFVTSSGRSNVNGEIINTKSSHSVINHSHSVASIRDEVLTSVSLDICEEICQSSSAATVSEVVIESSPSSAEEVDMSRSSVAEQLTTIDETPRSKSDVSSIQEELSIVEQNENINKKVASRNMNNDSFFRKQNEIRPIGIRPSETNYSEFAHKVSNTVANVYTTNSLAKAPLISHSVSEFSPLHVTSKSSMQIDNENRKFKPVDPLVDSVLVNTLSPSDSRYVENHPWQTTHNRAFELVCSTSSFPDATAGGSTSPATTDTKDSAGTLSSTVSLLQTLQEEEEIKFQHHKSLLKLQVWRFKLVELLNSVSGGIFKIFCFHC